MSGRILGCLLAALLVVGGCEGEQEETVGTAGECIQKVSLVVDQEFLEERNSSLVEIGAGRRDLVSSIAQACSESSPDDPVQDVAERAVQILNPYPPPEEM